jgi:hypothetical protein
LPKKGKLNLFEEIFCFFYRDGQEGTDESVPYGFYTSSVCPLGSHLPVPGEGLAVSGEMEWNLSFF